MRLRVMQPCDFVLSSLVESGVALQSTINGQAANSLH
jgi:hypothetical protein